MVLYFFAECMSIFQTSTNTSIELPFYYLRLRKVPKHTTVLLDIFNLRHVKVSVA